MGVLYFRIVVVHYVVQVLQVFIVIGFSQSAYLLHKSFHFDSQTGVVEPNHSDNINRD